MAEEDEGRRAVHLAGWCRSPCWGAERRRSVGFGSARCWQRAFPGLPMDGRIGSGGEKSESQKKGGGFHFDSRRASPTKQ